MQFALDHRTYTVHIAPSRLLLDGDECNAKVNHDRLRIEIASDVDRHERKRHLLHELRHVWRDLRGRAADDERDADDVAAFADWFDNQFAQQGGAAVLEALNPEVRPRPSRILNGPQAQTFSACGCCGASVAVGSIASSEPIFDADMQAWTIVRGMHCDACGRVTTWSEVCREDGCPLGAIMAHPRPRVLLGTEAARWLREHADVANVVIAN